MIDDALGLSIDGVAIIFVVDAVLILSEDDSTEEFGLCSTGVASDELDCMGDEGSTNTRSGSSLIGKAATLDEETCTVSISTPKELTGGATPVPAVLGSVRVGGTGVPVPGASYVAAP